MVVPGLRSSPGTEKVPGLRRSQDKMELRRFYMFTFCPILAVFSWTVWVQEEYVSLNWLIW